MTVNILRIDYHLDLLALQQVSPEQYPCLLESNARQTTGAQATARWDILFACPQQRLVLDHNGILSQDDRQITAHDFPHDFPNDFLSQLDQLWRQAYCVNDTPTELPFHGGWFVYLGYELAGQIEPSLQLVDSDNTMPRALAQRFPAAIIKDHLQARAYIVCENDYSELMAVISADLNKVRPLADMPDQPLIQLLQEDPAQNYIDAIAKIKQYIRDGDVFQVNISRAWRGHVADHVTPATIYQQLRETNPAPFAGLCLLGEHAVISSSPERLVRTTAAGLIETRPIAGTHPRARDSGADQALSAALMAHPKERAEHIMLIDMERNDLGRVCQYGSVRVNELMVLERYAHVHHIVSNIQGQLAQHTTPGQILRAVFPGGTITGCPKVRCMEIIAELEQAYRGPYTGAMGYLNRDGSMDLNILIRTMQLSAKRLHFRTGAGIVADSIAQRELAETRAKAKGLLLALHGTCDNTPEAYEYTG